MNAEPPDNTPRRIIIALDASSDGTRTLESIVPLAAALRAKLLGLFVEESDLLEMAALPMTRAIPAHGIGEAFLDAAIMRRAMRARAAALRRALEDLSAHWEVEAHFEIAPGVLADQLSARTTESDLVTLNDEKTDAATSDFVEHAPCAVLRLRRGTQPHRHPTIVIDNGEDRLLAAGLHWSRAFGSRLKVLIPPGQTAARSGAVATWVARHHATADIIELDASTMENPNAALAPFHPGTVIFSRRSKFGASFDPSREPACALLAF